MGTRSGSARRVAGSTFISPPGDSRLVCLDFSRFLGSKSEVSGFTRRATRQSSQPDGQAGSRRYFGLERAMTRYDGLRQPTPTGIHMRRLASIAIVGAALLLVISCDGSKARRASDVGENEIVRNRQRLEGAGNDFGRSVETGTSTSNTQRQPPFLPNAAKIGILFVGNSHTYMHDLPAIVCNMIQFQNPKKSAVSQHIIVNFLEDLTGDPRCRKEIESGAWQCLVLQAQKISASGKFNYSRQEGLDLAKLAKGRGMSVIYYPEWGLRGVAGDGQRQEKVYREMARDAGVGLAPVAVAWDLALAERPDLALHGPDGNHQSPLGAFLTACVLYGSITGNDPAKLEAFPYPHGTEQERTFLAKTAAKALAKNSE